MVSVFRLTLTWRFKIINLSWFWMPQQCLNIWTFKYFLNHTQYKLYLITKQILAVWHTPSIKILWYYCSGYCQYKPPLQYGLGFSRYPHPLNYHTQPKHVAVCSHTTVYLRRSHWKSIDLFWYTSSDIRKSSFIPTQFHLVYSWLIKFTLFINQIKIKIKK